MSQLVTPHGGGALRPLLLEGPAHDAELKRAESLPRLPLASREAGDLIMLGIGGFTPLDGFMDSANWKSVCTDMTLAGGTFWPIPITLSAEPATLDGINEGDDVALFDPRRNEILGTMTVTEQYPIDKSLECKEVFRTDDDAHPGVKMVMAQGGLNVAGPVKVLSDGGFPLQYGELYMTPAQTRAAFEQRGWKTVAAFQTRNPMHRAHEYLAKVAIEVCDGVMVHSLLGGLKPGDIPADVRTRAISALIENYFVQNTVIQSGYPLDMRYAGPREALLHAVFRQNYGCSHLIVGRDHAGVGQYYGPYDAHGVFDQIPAGALQTKSLKFDLSFWSYKVGGMASTRTCPGTNEDRLSLSGTKLREMLSEGADIPPEFSRPEVVAILREYYQNL